MAYAQKGDPLKKQKDSLNFKNKAVDKLMQEAQRVYKPSRAHQKLRERVVETYKASKDKAKEQRSVSHWVALTKIKEETGGLRATPTHKPKPRKPVMKVESSITPRGVQLTPTPAPKAAKMSTPITNRLTPPRPSATLAHPRKVKTIEKERRRKKKKITKTKY